MQKEIAYLVLSCDPFSDIWDAYGQLINRFWPDCPFDRYFASHHKAFNKYGFTPILIGEDKSWSNGLKVVLEKLQSIGYKYVISAFDDFLIDEPVKTEIILKAANEFIRIDGTRLGLQPELNPKSSHFNDLFGKIPNRVPYRATLGFAIWNIDRLMSIIDVRESAWEFEKEGVVRSFVYDDIYCLYEPAIKHINLIIKRKLVKENYDRLRELIPNIKIEREIFTGTIKEKIKGWLLVAFIHHFPAKYQWPVYNYISKPTAIDKKESLKKKNCYDDRTCNHTTSKIP